MVLILSGLIILVAMILIVKRYEVRMVLFCAALLIGCVAGAPMSAFKSFTAALKQTGLLEPVIAAMGFSVVMQTTGCNKHLIMFLAKYVKNTGFFLIPCVMFSAMFVNVSLTSTAGIAAAVGTIFIPVMISAGIHPGMAAATVLSGTFGSYLNPGYAVNVITAQVANVDPVVVIQNQALPIVICAVLVATTLVLVAYYRKEHKGYVLTEKETETMMVLEDDFKVNYLKALMPILPVVMIMICAARIIPGVKTLSIGHAMIMGVMITFLVTRENPQKLTKEFFKGAGEAFGSIYGIIIVALVLVDAMQVSGMIKSLTNLMISHVEIATISATFGPWLMAVLSGSGEAAATAFNTAITVHAADFGLSPLNMGAMAGISGAFGRAMSPVAGGVIIAAATAGLSPFEVVKRSAPGMLVACVAMYIMLLYLR